MRLRKWDHALDPTIPQQPLDAANGEEAGACTVATRQTLTVAIAICYVKGR